MTSGRIIILGELSRLNSLIIDQKIESYSSLMYFSDQLLITQKLVFIKRLFVLPFLFPL